MANLPAFPQGFTPEFLQQALADRLPAGVRVASVTRTSLGQGTGMMAEIARLTLGYSGPAAGLPATLIAKFASQNPTNRQIALMYNLYERETRYYAELDPHTEACCPSIYFTGLAGENFVILMEDLAGYEVGDQETGATLGQTELAIDELAKLHSAFWQRVDHLDWVPGIADSYHADNMRNLAHTGWEPMIAAFGHLIPASIQARKTAFLAAIPALQAHMRSAPVTLCHGDYRMENLLYGKAPGQHPVAIIDWQGPLQSRGMFDVALFVGQSTRLEVRREHERALLRRYLEGLQQRGVGGLTWDGVWDDYRRTNLYNWVYTTVVAGTLDATNDKGFRWMSQMVTRQVAVSEDLDLFDLLPR